MHQLLTGLSHPTKPPAAEMPDSYKPDILLGQPRGREVPTGIEELVDIKPSSCKGPTALLWSGWPCHKVPEEVSNGVLLMAFKPRYNWVIGPSCPPSAQMTLA